MPGNLFFLVALVNPSHIKITNSFLKQPRRVILRLVLTSVINGINGITSEMS